jgi:hypothetical protein
MAACPEHYRHTRRAQIRAGAVGLFALTACAAPPSEGWTKPGATTAELRRDLVDCERIATGEEGFHFRALNETYEEARDEIPRRKAECMRERGWQQALS